MRRLFLAVIVCLCATFVAACSNAPAPDANPTPAAVNIAAVAAPEEGKTTVVGKVVSTKTGNPLGDTPVRLAEVIRNNPNEDGVYVLDVAMSPSALTTADGSFTIANVDVKEYVIVIGDVYGAHVIVPDDTNKKPKIWGTEIDKVMDFGTFNIDL